MMVPGRILIVDDKKGEVQDLVDELLRMGEHAIYSGLPVNSELCANARLLILDYWLDESSEKNSLQHITTIIDDVAEKSKFFMIVIWSAKVADRNRKEYGDNIRNEYKNRFGQTLPGILLDPISKNELNYVKLIEKIDIEITEFPELNLIYEIEKIVDRAKYKVKTVIYEIGNWSNLIKSLKEEYDRDSIKRQILYMYVNILRRNIQSTDRLGSCIEKVLHIDETFDVTDFGKVYSAQYYYAPSKKEQIGTGDILQQKKTGRYYIIVTSECDITHDKHTTTKMIEAARIDHSRLCKQELLDKIAEFCNVKPKDVPNAILNEVGLRSNYCRLAFLIDDNKQFFHLVFDFNKIKTLKKVRKVSELGNYDRICRVDSPLINSFLQRYASFCLRFGTINIPKSVLRDVKTRTTPKRKEKPKKAKVVKLEAKQTNVG